MNEPGREISELAELLPAPAGRDLPTARKQILKEHLMTEISRASQPGQAGPAGGQPAPHRRPRRPRRPVLVTGAVLAAVAVAATVVGTNAGHTKQAAPAPHASVTTAELFAKIADAAARQPTPTVRDSDFTYIRSEVAYTTYTVGSDGRETSTMAKLHERQIWLPVANLCVTGLLVENGERTPISPLPVVNGKVDPSAVQGAQLNFSCPSEGHLGDATYRLLQSVPTEPAALIDYLKAGKKWTNDDPPTEIGDLIREAIVPPALAAALYRVAALLPGATLVPDATNAVGRAGIGIMWTSTTAKQVYKNEWIFDKTTLQFIGERTYDPATGKLTGESAIVQQAFTAKAGQLP